MRSRETMIPHDALFLRHYWHLYRTQLPECYGGRSKKEHISSTTLWRFHNSDIRSSWLGMIEKITEPRVCATLKTLTRLYDVKRQRRLVENGTMDGMSTTDDLHQIDDDKVDKFISLCVSRLDRIQKWMFEERIIHRMLKAIGLFKFSKYDDDSLPAWSVVTLACSGQITGEIAGNRNCIRKSDRQRLRKGAILELLKHIIHYFTGGRIFLWLSSLLYWRHWREYDGIYQE